MKSRKDLDAKQQQRTAVVAEELRQRERRMTEAERDMELRRAEPGLHLECHVDHKQRFYAKNNQKQSIRIEEN